MNDSDMEAAIFFFSSFMQLKNSFHVVAELRRRKLTW